MNETTYSTAEAALIAAKETAGGSSGIARAISELRAEPITPQAVSQWKVVPPGRVIDVERISGIPRRELRPDIYPDEAAQ